MPTITTRTLTVDKNLKITPIFKQTVPPAEKILRISTAPSTISVRQGEQATFNVLINRTGFTGEVGLLLGSRRGRPDGLGISPEQVTTSTDTAVLVVTATTNTPVGRYVIPISATTQQGAPPAQTNVEIEVTPAVTPPVTTPPVTTPPATTWINCIDNSVNTGTPPTGYRLTSVRQGNTQFVCYEPSTQIGFTPSLNNLEFTYTQRSPNYPTPITVQAQNPSYGSSYSVHFTVDTTYFTVTPNVLRIPPRETKTFTISPVQTVLNTIDVGNRTVQLTVQIDEI